MADIREGILVELLNISNSLPGVLAAARNVTDVSGLARPSIVINDGAEEVVSQPDSASETLVAIVEMTPAVEIRIGGAPNQIGSIANLILARLRYRVVTSSAIKQLISKNGKILIQGASLVGPTPESKETRMDCGFAFRYYFRAEDLADL
jgi:hypothetical protein